ALTHLQYGLSGRPGLTVLIGEAGTGKTTLVRTALHTVNGLAACIVHVSNPTLTRSEFFEFLADGFGFTHQAALSKTRFLHELRETAAYITARIRIAGGAAEQLFSREAVIAIHDHSRGIPRTISVICDNALVNGLAVGQKPVGRDIVLEVCRDFHIRNAPPVTGEPVANKPLVDQPTEASSGAPSEAVGIGPQPIFATRPRRFSFF